MFGKVTAGETVVRRIEALATTNDRPNVDVVISDCGELPSDDDLSSSGDMITHPATKDEQTLTADESK